MYHRALFDILFPQNISPIKIILAVSIFLIALGNFSFFRNLLAQYPLTLDNAGFLLSVAVGFTAVIVLVLAIFCHRYTLKPIIILLLMASSFAAYFMDSYSVLIDTDMIHNALSTDIKEVHDLLSPTMFFYFIVLGLLPSLWLYKQHVEFKPFKQELWSRVKLMGFIFLLLAAMFFAFSASYSSFFREHKAIRYYFNPGNYIYSIAKNMGRSLKHNDIELHKIGLDAKIIRGADKKRRLIIVVVGETARADRFSINGYKRQTTPLLAKEQVVSFSNFTSCGTSTAVSVPCMFSVYGVDDFEKSKAKYTENVLDILQHAGVNLLWRDNNSSSKGVADRITYQDYRSAKVNRICDIECRDEGMLLGLREYINSHEKGDIVIILHQMGNHGPAYYKRYPQKFEKFTPVCKTNELADCTLAEINNAYDNAILYTDYFLSRIIELLKGYEGQFATAMLYISDHGESLGENGLYLHGMPNFVAPDVQRQVPVIMWLGDKSSDIADYNKLLSKRAKSYSHDNIFHTLLGMLDVKSKVYRADLDITSR